MTSGWIKSHIRLPIKNGQYRVACAYGDNESYYEADANYFTHDKRFANPVTGANMTSDVIAWFEIPPFEYRRPLSAGLELIADERVRQIVSEGWTAEHDDSENVRGELSMAGSMYAQHASYQCKHPYAHISHDIPYDWPDGWSGEWWKPSISPIRNLVKAGALIAAEIDRLQRVQSGEGDK